jgi:hypothetical protein
MTEKAVLFENELYKYSYSVPPSNERFIYFEIEIYDKKNDSIKTECIVYNLQPKDMKSAQIVLKDDFTIH